MKIGNEMTDFVPKDDDEDIELVLPKKDLFWRLD